MIYNALMYKLNFKKNESAGSVPNLNSYAQSRSHSYKLVDKPNSGSLGKKYSYKPPKIKKGELPKSIPSCS
jgi:hypothetical protein